METFNVREIALAFTIAALIAGFQIAAQTMLLAR